MKGRQSILGSCTPTHVNLHRIVSYTRKAERVRRNQPGAARRRTSVERYREAWSADAAAPQSTYVPAHSQLSDVPLNLVMRAAREKLPWVRRFVAEGCPWGHLRRYAEDYADAMGIPRSEVPPYTTLNTWAHRYKEYGLRGLVDRVRKDAESYRALTTEQEHELEIGLFGGKANYSSLAQMLAARSSDEEIPSYHTVRRAARRLEERDPHLAAIARHGLLWWRNHYRLALSHGVLPGGYRLSVDSTVADIWVRIPDQSLPEGWRPIRPVLTVVTDVGTRLWAAFNLSLVAVDSGIICGTFLRACNQDVQDEVHPGLISPGIPFEVCLDQGSEHRGGFRKLLDLLGVEVVPGRENEPEAHAHVERLIETITQQLFRLLPGFSETHKVFNPYAPPEADAKRRVRDLKYDPYRLELPVTSLSTLDELEERILAWATVYNHRPHSGLPAESVALQQMIRASLHPQEVGGDQHVQEVA